MLKKRDLVEAIHNDRLAEIDDPEVQRICGAIGDRLAAELSEVIAHLDQAGIAASSVGDLATPKQRHVGALTVADSSTAMAAVETLNAIGYQSWETTEGPGRAINLRFRAELTLAKTTDVTVALNLRWPANGVAGAVPSALVPNANDFDTVSLPASLWPLYFLVRPVRLMVERIGLQPKSSRVLGPFLSTPESLIGPLLELGDIGPDDTVVDIGCGDGRILMAAVERYGCRAIGMESNDGLVAQARRQADNLGLGDRIEIVNGDAVENLSTVAAAGTVFFVFVPADAASQLVRSLLEISGSGTTVIAHEQHRMPEAPPGAEPIPLLTDQGVTVAHRWLVDRAG